MKPPHWNALILLLFPLLVWSVSEFFGVNRAIRSLQNQSQAVLVLRWVGLGIILAAVGLSAFHRTTYLVVSTALAFWCLWRVVMMGLWGWRIHQGLPSPFDLEGGNATELWTAAAVLLLLTAGLWTLAWKLK